MSHPQPPAAARDDAKERVRDAIDISEVVGSYIALRRQGKAMVGLCPWHDDSRPSLQVNPERQTFRCWVCDVGGDVVNFVMRMERIEFREALEQLADRAGITLARGRGGLPADAKAGLRAALEWAASRFRECLKSAPEAAAARAYVTDRGLDPATIDRFELGFAPASWDWLQRQAATAGIAAADLVRAGLAVERADGSGHYDRFRGRVMFPIRDPQGRCVAFGGRVLPGADDAAKYINSPETALFSKSTMLYGLDTARDAISKSRRAIVVEGYTDCLAARQAGIHDVVAVLGTALTAKHAALLRRYADTIVLVLDGDDAGRRRADEVLDVLLAEPVDVRIARLPSGVDPCEFVLERGRAAFDALVAGAGDPLEYRMDEALGRLAPNAGPEAALDAVESVLKALAAAATAGPGDSQRKLREDRVLGRLSRRFGLSREALRGRLLDLRRAGSGPVREEADPALEERPRLPAWDREVIEVLVGVPGGAGVVVRRVGSGGVESHAGRAVMAAAERLHGAGREVGLSELLLEVADPGLQSLLVGMAESGADRAGADPRERMMHFEEALKRRAAARRARESALALQGDGLDTETTAKLLERLVAERRAAQGIAEPKDG
ncbi:MAG: DNA primase [Planctomycetaceae bacterium]